MSGLQEERTIYLKRSGLAAYHILGLDNGLSVNSSPGPVLAQWPSNPSPAEDEG